jgi:ketose-bisphosphate aldolase
MKRPSVAKMMKSACEKQILIPAFNIAYLPMTRPVAQTLKRLGTFGLIEAAMPDITRFGAESFEAVAAEYRKEADPEFVALHLDHIPVIDEEHMRLDWESFIRKGVAAGYESVMLDGSRLPLDENIAAVRKVVEICHPKVAVEAELGAVLGHEAGPIPPYEELFRSKKGFTDPEEARRFVKETGVDWLSVAVGSIHGAITGAGKDQAKVAARLHIEHLRLLRQITGVPLVLHGGSGVQKQSVLDGIKNGIAKINIGTEIRQAYEKPLAADKGEKAAQDAVAVKIEELIVEVYGIAGTQKKLCG